ncbi:hypothetical protein BJX62DRAFT_181054 [Aspergillus germanicus]
MQRGRSRSEQAAELAICPKNLHYDVSHEAWARHYDSLPRRRQPVWTCEVFVEVMEPHYETLEELTMTESDYDCDGIVFYGDGVDFSDFEALRVLRINSNFLFPVEEELRPLWEVLPEGLEELEVYYHAEPRDTCLFRGWSDRNMYLYDIPGWWPGAHWLFELLQARKAGDINLKKVTICTPERHPTESAGLEHVPSEKRCEPIQTSHYFAFGCQHEPVEARCSIGQIRQSGVEDLARG